MTTMRRWVLSGFGRENLRLEDVPIPEPRPGEVLVKVAAVSLNYRDKLVIAGGMGRALDFPFTPASDLAGTIVLLGDGVTRFREGDRVISTFFPDWIDGAPSGDARTPDGNALAAAIPASFPTMSPSRQVGLSRRRAISIPQRPAPCPAPA